MPELEARFTGKQALAGGDQEEVGKVARNALVIDEVRTSRPLLDFNNSHEVYVKVVWSLASDSGSRRTSYFLFLRGGIGNTWSYERTATVIGYYLNFF